MKNRSLSVSRRAFLSAAAGAAACPYLIPSSALGNDKHLPASERIVMGGIGIGNMGSGDLGAFLGRKEVQYVAVCDVKKGARDGAKAQVDRNIRTRLQDLQRFPRGVGPRRHRRRTRGHARPLARDHRDRGLPRGKDVYCQKPESRTIREGRLMVRAARRSTAWFPAAASACWTITASWPASAGAGRRARSRRFSSTGWAVAAVQLAGRAGSGGRGLGYVAGPGPLGAVPSLPHQRQLRDQRHQLALVARLFRRRHDRLGAHNFGGAMFAANVREQGPVEIIPPDGKDRPWLTYRFANGLLIHHSPGKGKWTWWARPAKSCPPSRCPQYKGTGGIYGDFLACCRTREKPFRDIELASHGHGLPPGQYLPGCSGPLKWDAVRESSPATKKPTVSWIAPAASRGRCERRGFPDKKRRFRPAEKDLDMRFQRGAWLVAMVGLMAMGVGVASADDKAPVKKDAPKKESAKKTAKKKPPVDKGLPL